MTTLFFAFGFMFLRMLIPLIVIFLVFKLLSKGGCCLRGGPKETPMDILKRRYAAGEITKEEFDRIKKDLM